jgi:hypothetical protein
MSVTIAGILKDGMGNFLPNVRLELHAKKTSSQVIINSEAVFYTNNTGNYSFTVLTGSYSLFIDFGSVGPQYIGEINILVDSINGTLENFLTIPGEEEITPEILQQVLQARLDAQTAAQEAARWALEAAQSAQNSAGLQAPYKDDAAAQAAITAGTIPNGGVVSVIGTDPNAAYTFKFNNNGTLETILDTSGKPKIFPNFLWYLAQLIRIDANAANMLISAGIHNIGGTNAFEIASAAKQIAVFLDNKGLFGVNSGMFNLGTNKFTPLPESSEYAFVFSDDRDAVVFGIGKAGWIEVLGLRMYRDGPSENCIVLADEDGAMAATLSNRGVVTVYDTGATPEPTPVLDFVERLHIFIYGQSLSNGAYGTPILNTPTYDSLMYNTGVRSRDSGIPTSFVDLKEATWETIASGFSYEFTKKSGGMNGRKLLMNAGGVNGERIQNLRKGTGPYNAALAQFSWAHTEMVAEGYNHSIDYMFWLQGEANMADGMSKLTYQNHLTGLRTELETDTVGYREAGKPLVMLTYQTSSHGYYNGTPENPPEEIARGQLEMSLTNPNIDCVGPTYYGPHATTSGNVHHSSHGYRWVGLYFQKALRHRLRTGQKWVPLYPTKARLINARTMLVDFHVPVPPLKFDEENITPLQDGMKGAEVHDAAGRLTVLSVVIVGGTQLKLTTNRDIGEGAFFAAAWTPENRGTYDPATNRWPDWFFGPITGVRSNICDSDPELTDLIGPNGKPYPLHNFCCIHKVEVTQ